MRWREAEGVKWLLLSTESLLGLDAAEMVMIGSGAGMGRGARPEPGRGEDGSALLKVLEAERMLRLLLWPLGLRGERVEVRMPGLRPWVPSSSSLRGDLRMRSPIRGEALTARGWTGALTRVRACICGEEEGREKEWRNGKESEKAAEPCWREEVGREEESRR